MAAPYASYSRIRACLKQMFDTFRPRPFGTLTPSAAPFSGPRFMKPDSQNLGLRVHSVRCLLSDRNPWDRLTRGKTTRVTLTGSELGGAVGPWTSLPTKASRRRSSDQATTIGP